MTDYADGAYEEYLVLEEVLEDPYENLRELLAPGFAYLPPEDIEEVIWQTLGDISPEELEGFWSSLKKFGRKAGRVAQRALPGMIQGATTGAAVGGPYGAIIGALGGGALGAMQKPRGGKRPPATRPVAGKRPTTRPRAAPAPAGSPAAAQLLQTLLNPQVLQALMSMVMGKAGQKQVQVGSTPVPTAAIANLLGQLANRAAAEHNALVAPHGEAVPSYLLDASGEFVVDPANPEERAARLLDLLQEAAWEDAASLAWEEDWEYEVLEDDWDAMEEEEYYDSLDLFDALLESVWED